MAHVGARRRFARPRSWDYERAYRLNLVRDLLLQDPTTPVADLILALHKHGLPAHERTVYHLLDEVCAMPGLSREPAPGWPFSRACRELHIGKRRLRWIIDELGMPEPLPGPVRKWAPAEWHRLLHRLETERWRRPQVMKMVRSSAARRGPVPHPSGRDPLGYWWDPDVVLRWREERAP